MKHTPSLMSVNCTSASISVLAFHGAPSHAGSLKRSCPSMTSPRKPIRNARPVVGGTLITHLIIIIINSNNNMIL